MRRPATRQYIVGIDLGTSNTVVAYAAPGEQQVELLPIEQLVGPGQVAARPLLPSVRYHPAPGEISPADRLLPWSNADDEPAITGRLALELGAQVPGRLVSSAKSWLSHAAVDRLAASLGGRLEAMYFAFGDTDVFMIVELPDAASMAAAALTAAASGEVAVKTTVLLTAEEVDAATKKVPHYRPPGQ